MRNSFIRDYDRIIFSSAFRRLQNKTQVFPLPGAVFVHNRLTHSLEVSSVGRSLGKAAGENIARYNAGAGSEFTDFYRYELPSVIASACLAHDIGNPPFGHSGENAIRAFFTGLEGEMRTRIQDAISQEQLMDFEFFEGNSNAFRVLTHSYNEDEPGGYKLTYTTLAAIIKYPCASIEGFKKTGLIATKKSGFFHSEKEAYLQLAAEMDIPKTVGYQSVHARHPFVFLTEAADDICYRVIDLEDAHRLHIASLDTIKDLLFPFFNDREGYNSRAYVENKVNRIHDHNQKVQYLRARWIGLMVDKLSTQFWQHEEELLAGTLQKDLLRCLPADEYELVERINQYSVEHIYNYRSVVEIEIAGYNVIGGLLKEFIHAVLNPKLTKSEKIIKLISQQFPVKQLDFNMYQNIQSIVDFIAGMSDLYAIDLFRKITGISIPEIR